MALLKSYDIGLVLDIGANSGQLLQVDSHFKYYSKLVFYTD
jgi:hypothetical protein